MPEIEDQLRRYGAALERRLLEPAADDRPGSARRTRPSPLALVAASLVFVSGAVVTSVVLDDERSVVSTTPSTTNPAADSGVFSTPTGVVLLFSDGIDGVTAIDLDHRLAGRSVIDGERAGDQQFRLTLTGEHLIVGWGEVHAAPLTGGRSTRIADHAVHVPAAEPGEVWVMGLSSGGRGPGSDVQRVRTDGTVTFAADDVDLLQMEPLLGVPGGLAVRTPGGIAVWDAATRTVGRILGPGPASEITTDGRDLVWCASDCPSVHTGRLDRSGPATSRHVSVGRQRLALAPDGRHLALLRADGNRAQLVLVDRSTGQESVVATDLDPLIGAVQWTEDGQQLFYTESSYGRSTTTIGRFHRADDTWELVAVPVGDAQAGIILDPEEAAAFLAGERTSPSDCPGANGTYPSGRMGACTFTFPMPPGPAGHCASDGERTVTVPRAVGERLGDAIRTMAQAGLNVVGSGTPEGDPIDDAAIVRSQEPPAGARVPHGACVGFRTDG